MIEEAKIIKSIYRSKYCSKELAYFRIRKVGLIYQFYNLIPNLTVRHNIELPLKLDKRKINQDEFSDIVKKTWYRK